MYNTDNTTKYKYKNTRNNHEMITPPRSNKRHSRDEAIESTFALMLNINSLLEIIFLPMIWKEDGLLTVVLLLT